jgi:hypothetical protein
VKSAFEHACAKKREAAEALIYAAHSDIVEVLFSFSHLDCIIDVKVDEGWLRYELVEPSEDEPSTLRRLT